MNADKNGIQMSNAVQQYALFGNALFKLNKTVVHASDPRKQIVICSYGPDIRYATLEEWDKAGKSFGERAQTEGIVTSASPARDKLELFRNLFTGRKDVHAHGYRRKDGGIGYTPACANEWKPGICPKANHHRIKCAECRSRTFLELNDAAIIAHFKGSDDRLRDVIGQYVLDKDCNTNVLVIDFDKADWKEATNAIRLVVKNHGINAAVERSRSGNGAHIWFFFLEPINAKTARDFGSCLIAEAAALNKTITFEAFDRMIPAQSTIPEGGFGNLIALPFQGKAQREGNSVFVDERFEPFPDQWLYLSQIQLISRATVDRLIEDKEEQLATTRTIMYSDVIREREELSEQIRALKMLKELAKIYGCDISRPANNVLEATQAVYFSYLAAVKEQNGAAMSLGRTSTFLDIYAERDLKEGTFTEKEIQEIIDQFVMKLRCVKFARTPEIRLGGWRRSAESVWTADTW